MLHFTVGLPRSGKSTFANDWAAERPRRVVLSGDAFRLALHGQVYAREAEGFIPAISDVTARTLLTEGYDVMIDETNTSDRSLLRLLWLHPAPVPHVVNTHEAICVLRARGLGQHYLVPVISRISTQFSRLMNEGIQKALDRVALENHLSLTPALSR